MWSSDRPHRPRSDPSEIEVDADVSSSSEYDSERSDLTSLDSSVFNYIYENGRTYHSYRSGTYVLPNDEKEQDRLDLCHHVFRVSMHGNLCLTQLSNPQKILDIGTGTGIWVIDSKLRQFTQDRKEFLTNEPKVADEYPSAQVIGVDLSPIQPGWLPPNLKFIIDDANQEWDFPEESFDFIHIRGLAGCIEDWPTFLRQCYKHLKPGGRIEISDLVSRTHCDDDSYPLNCHYRIWEEQAEFFRVADIQGRLWDIVPYMHGFLEKAQFEGIKFARNPIPIGRWPKEPRMKEIGRYIRAQLVDSAAESYTLAPFTRFGGWSHEEVQVLLAHLRRELLSNTMHIYSFL
ncbi:S-adenosyl-L-methionine-dependent methyltransferase [Penicillium angulare]|uniref:S-adenosyl-L-methionine-dependent methyltransferase n=1 Tax=Penicillium angulare TaxID=116970 RepID=A0A9W9EV86_9EURO|nr:S-adenosyl-L-methionine-dependent methyltransferase [Penicillium angulare]